MAVRIVLACATQVLSALSVSVVAADGVCSAAEACEGPTTRSSVLLQTVSAVARDASNLTEEMAGGAGTCDEGSWPDRDHGRVCGSCKVLVDRFSSFYQTCDGYCNHIGRRCAGAWEERDDTCTVLHDMACDQSIDSSDAICECSAEVDGLTDTSEGSACGYGQLAHVAEEEGNAVGARVDTHSADECRDSCDADSRCKSFTLCPSWNKCWMKDRSLAGGEATAPQGDCKTYYKKQRCTAPEAPTATEAPTAPPTAPTTPAEVPPAAPGCTGSGCRSVKVMSYNTEYRNYDARMAGYAAKIQEVAPALVGLQECQNRDGLARLSGYTANVETGRQNYMLFDPRRVTLVSGGAMPIPTDGYAPRAVTWGQFRLGGVTVWFFNTHLPHNLDEASSQRTHARIAGMLLQKRRELGAEHAPTIVVGDMNSHASNFNKVDGGGFESNLEANGFVWAYTARGGPGYGGIDQILYSAAHWTHSGCGDTGTGGSDHTSITCDLALK